jgi:hypothetical protein
MKSERRGVALPLSRLDVLLCLGEVTARPRGSGGKHGGSCIIAPSGEIVARCTTKGDEIALARCDLDLCNSYKRTTFNFDVHRQPQTYGMIVERKGVATRADGTPVPPS